MRYQCAAFAVLMVGLLTGTGAIATAHADPDAPGTALSADHYGVLAGAADAPVQLELFCDPQCPDCAKFESRSGANISRYLASGQLAVTFRWLTFLDAKRHNDTSARVGNALMTAADPATPASAYQVFVADLYEHRDSHGNDSGGPGLDDIAAMARESGLPDQVADRIAAGQSVVDTIAMNAENRTRLNQANPESPSTPTVYDLRTHTVVDTDDAGWLDRLMQAG